MENYNPEVAVLERITEIAYEVGKVQGLSHDQIEQLRDEIPLDIEIVRPGWAVAEHELQITESAEGYKATIRVNPDLLGKGREYLDEVLAEETAHYVSNHYPERRGLTTQYAELKSQQERLLNQYFPKSRFGYDEQELAPMKIAEITTGNLQYLNEIMTKISKLIGLEIPEIATLDGKNYFLNLIFDEPQINDKLPFVDFYLELDSLIKMGLIESTEAIQIAEAKVKKSIENSQNDPENGRLKDFISGNIRFKLGSEVAKQIKVRLESKSYTLEQLDYLLNFFKDTEFTKNLFENVFLSRQLDRYLKNPPQLELRITHLSNLLQNTELVDEEILMEASKFLPGRNKLNNPDRQKLVQFIVSNVATSDEVDKTFNNLINALLNGIVTNGGKTTIRNTRKALILATADLPSDPELAKAKLKMVGYIDAFSHLANMIEIKNYDDTLKALTSTSANVGAEADYDLMVAQNSDPNFRINENQRMIFEYTIKLQILGLVNRTNATFDTVIQEIQSVSTEIALNKILMDSRRIEQERILEPIDKLIAAKALGREVNSVDELFPKVGLRIGYDAAIEYMTDEWLNALKFMVNNPGYKPFNGNDTYLYLFKNTKSLEEQRRIIAMLVEDRRFKNINLSAA